MKITNQMIKHFTPKELASEIGADHNICEKIYDNRQGSSSLIIRYAALFLRQNTTINDSDLVSLYWLYDALCLDTTSLNIADKPIIPNQYPVDVTNIDEELKKFYDPSQKNYSAFKGFPIKEAWRLCVDFDHQKTERYNIWDRYECPKGGNEKLEYMKYTFHMLTKAITQSTENITLDLIKKLHAEPNSTTSTLKNTLNSFAVSLTEMTYDGYCRLAKNYYMTPNSVSDSFLDSSIYYPAYNVTQMSNHKENMEIRKKRQPKLSHMPLKNSKNYLTNLDETINTILRQFYANIKDTSIKNNPRLLLYEVADMIRDLQCVHPFEDANGRLCYVALINMTLARYGFSPMIINDQGIISGLSNAEIVQHVIIPGMRNYQSVKNGQLPEGMVTTDQLIAKHGKKKFPIPEILESKAEDLAEFFKQHEKIKLTGSITCKGNTSSKTR